MLLKLLYAFRFSSSSGGANYSFCLLASVLLCQCYMIPHPYLGLLESHEYPRISSVKIFSGFRLQSHCTSGWSRNVVYAVREIDWIVFWSLSDVPPHTAMVKCHLLSSPLFATERTRNKFILFLTKSAATQCASNVHHLPTPKRTYQTCRWTYAW